jgi:Skp family chaperone for outer membrane proteins
MQKQVDDQIEEMTKQEAKLVTDYQTEMANKEQELADKAALRVSALEKLGLTADEVAALLS